MKWIWLIFRITRGAMGYCLGGALTFAVAGLVEGIIAGTMLAMIILPADKKLAAWVISCALSLGTGTGFVSGSLSFAIAGLIQNIRAEFHYYNPLRRYVPRDAAFWDCLRAALWASATFALAGAVTGALGGALWSMAHPPNPLAVQTFDYETICVLSGSGLGAAMGYFIGIVTGALAPESVQTARQRVKEWRENGFRAWQQARTEWQR